MTLFAEIPQNLVIEPERQTSLFDIGIAYHKEYKRQLNLHQQEYQEFNSIG